MNLPLSERRRRVGCAAMISAGDFVLNYFLLMNIDAGETIGAGERRI
jgi:hypothetical protein